MDERVGPTKSIRDFPVREVPNKEIVIYICPEKECPSYYASQNFLPTRGITNMQFHRSQQDGSRVASHTRTECPLCRTRGKRVERVAYIVTEVVLLEPAIKAVQRQRGEAAGAAL